MDTPNKILIGCAILCTLGILIAAGATMVEATKKTDAPATDDGWDSIAKDLNKKGGKIYYQTDPTHYGSFTTGVGNIAVYADENGLRVQQGVALTTIIPYDKIYYVTIG